MADPAGVLQEIDQLVPGRPVHVVSAASGDGLEALRVGVHDLLATLPARALEPAAVYAGDGPPAQTRVIDAALDFGRRREREPEHGVEAVVHVRGAASPGRLARLGGRFWQVRLERPVVAAAGDRLVVRRPAGGDAGPGAYTLGGGIVLDPAARRHPTSNESIVRLTRIWRGLPPLPPEPPRRS
jgi:selenocysteine-specific elongation factor